MNTQPYVYCPYCATKLEYRLVFDRVRPVCPQGHFVYFRDPKVGVIALVTHQERVLLVQRAVDPGRGLWALPGGYMDPGEMPEEAVRREFLEEVNLPIQIECLLDIYPMADENGGSKGIVLAYAASLASSDPTIQVGDDVSAADWFAPHELPANLAFTSTRTLLESWQKGFE